MPSLTTNSYFVLEGAPHPLGSYPPDIPEPHGCIPPHLYYATTVYEHSLDPSSSFSSHLSTTPKRTWTLPYVHRLGDGRDDAGGLTSAYHLLVDLEDADDFGAFIEQHIMEKEQEEEGEEEQEEGESGEQEQDCKKEAAMLYACTNILVGEARVLSVIQSHFFEPWSKGQRSPPPPPQTGLEIPLGLTQLKDIFATLSHASLVDHPFSLCISDLQLVLPE